MDKEWLLKLLRRKEAEMEEAYWHLSRAPEPLLKIREQIAKLGGYGRP